MEFNQIKNKAIEDLYKLHIPEKVWRYANKELLPDFSLYCFLLILELPDEKLVSLLDLGELANYFFILCKRLMRHDSKFFILHKTKMNFIYDESYCDPQRGSEEGIE